MDDSSSTSNHLYIFEGKSRNAELSLPTRRKRRRARANELRGLNAVAEVSAPATVSSARRRLQQS